VKKHFHLILTIILLSVIFSQTTLAEEQYSEDYFVLKSEKFPASEDASSSFFTNGFDLVVNRNKVSAHLKEDFDFPFFETRCTGTMSFDLAGDRDTKTGNMKGTMNALMDGTCPGNAETPASPITLTWDGTFDGFATFAIDPSDGTRRIMKGKITNLQGKSILTVYNSVIPTTPGTTTIDFPEVVLEGFINDSGARFSDLLGQVKIRPDIDKRGWHSLEPGEAIPFGTHISTETNSSVVIILPDGVTFFLKPNTEIIINKPSEKKGHSQILYGSMKIIVEKKIQDESLEIDMDQAVVEISGTTLILEEKEEKSILQVIEGEVSFTSKSDNKKISVVAGSMVSASSVGLGSVETFDTTKVTADWAAFVSSDTKETTDFTSNGFLVLYGLLSVLAVFIIVIIVRKIKR